MIRPVSKLKKHSTNMLRITVLVIILESVCSELPQQLTQQRHKFHDSGKLLRVVEQSRNAAYPMNSQVFYYIPENIDVPEEGKNLDIHALTTNTRFVEKNKKLLAEELRMYEEENSKLTSNAQVGVYYIYHPNGILQRVQYVTKNDDDKMTISTNVGYETVEPITGPIYTYDPQTLLFRQI